MDDDSCDNLYARQKTLGLTIPSGLTIVGCGGVGSWTAFKFAISGVKTIVLIDDDIVEPHNLNRTPFWMVHIGKPKVTSLAEIIAMSRPECNVIVFNKRWESLTTDEEKIARTYEIVDCRDNIEPINMAKLAIRGGYDGKNITIHIQPDFNDVFGYGETGYRTIPSYVVPPSVISDIIVNYMLLERHRKKNVSETIFELNMDNYTRKLAGRKFGNIEKMKLGGGTE